MILVIFILMTTDTRAHVDLYYATNVAPKDAEVAADILLSNCPIIISKYNPNVLTVISQGIMVQCREDERSLTTLKDIVETLKKFTNKKARKLSCVDPVESYEKLEPPYKECDCLHLGDSIFDNRTDEIQHQCATIQMYLDKENANSVIAQWKKNLQTFTLINPIEIYLAIYSYYALDQANEVIMYHQKYVKLMAPYKKCMLFKLYGKIVADSLIRAKKYEECKEFLKEEIKERNLLNRGIKTLYLWIGKCAFYTQDESMLKEYEDKNIEVKIIYAKFLVKQKRIPEAEQKLKSLIGLKKKETSMINLLLGDLKFKTKEYNEAIKYYGLYEKKMGQDDTHVDYIKYCKGRCYFQLKEYERAFQMFSACKPKLSFKQFNKYNYLTIARGSVDEFCNKCKSEMKKSKSKEKDNKVSEVIKEFPAIRYFVTMDDYFSNLNPQIFLPNFIESISSGVLKKLFPIDALHLIKIAQGEKFAYPIAKLSHSSPDYTKQLLAGAVLHSFARDNLIYESGVTLKGHLYASIHKHMKLLRHLKPNDINISCQSYCNMLMYALFEARRENIGDELALEEYRGPLKALFPDDHKTIDDTLKEFDRL